MLSWRQTVLSQFASSPKLMSLLAAIEAWLDPNANFELFYNQVWNIETASGWGLDVLGRIVHIPRTVTLTGIPVFGFAEAGDRVGFDQGPFYEATIGVTENFELQDSVYRLLVLAKAAFNITNGSVPAINAIMMSLFSGSENAYVTDGRNIVLNSFGFAEAGDRVGFDQGTFGDLLYGTLPASMTLTYVFNFALQPYQVAIAQSGVLPKPTGVAPFWSYRVSSPSAPPSQTYLSDDGGVLAVSVFANYPSSAAGLPAGAVWSDGGAVSVVPGITPNPLAPAVYFGITAQALFFLGGGNLPLVNPSITGQLWNNGGVISISTAFPPTLSIDPATTRGVLVVSSNAGYPTSAVGLLAGAVWSDGGVVSVVPGITPNPLVPPVYFGISSAALLSLGGGNLPLSNPGDGSGQLWNNGGVVCVA